MSRPSPQLLNLTQTPNTAIKTTDLSRATPLSHAARLPTLTPSHPRSRTPSLPHTLALSLILARTHARTLTRSLGRRGQGFNLPQGKITSVEEAEKMMKRLESLIEVADKVVATQ
eukprot:446971-Rhodomonas_salina.1